MTPGAGLELTQVLAKMISEPETLGRRWQRDTGGASSAAGEEETSRGHKKMRGCRRRQQITGPSWKGQNPVTASVTLTVLIWASLCKTGSPSQNSTFTLAVPASVSVQRGLCVHIPCRFTYDRSKRTVSEKLYGYWFQKREGSMNHTLVATNNNTQRAESSFANRFLFTGNPEEGDCSFSILNARSQDKGAYFFQIADSSLRYIYLTSKDPVPMTLHVLVTEFTEKPEIVKLSAVISGKEAVVACLAPGPCSKIELEISWETDLTGNKTSQWSQQDNTGRWTYGSNFTFTPSLNDRGKSLTCRVWYPHIQQRVETTIFPDGSTTHHQFGWPSVTLFVVILCLIKVLFYSLFFFSVIWCSNRRKVP
ncbi:UNVERIFIED_CONTAM: hypothetical protein K2H54_024512 [Gekko kuhli]